MNNYQVIDTSIKSPAYIYYLPILQIGVFILAIAGVVISIVVIIKLFKMFKDISAIRKMMEEKK